MTLVGASVGLTAGCGGSAREQRMRKDLTDNICSDAEVQSLLQGLHPAQPADALAWRSLPYYPDEKPSDMSEEEWAAQVEQQVQSLAGQMVINETAGTCDAIEDCPLLPLPTQGGTWFALSYQYGSSSYGTSYHLVAYRAEKADFYYTQKELLAFLGTIDTPEEARFLIALDEKRIPCDGESNFKKDGSDYVFYTETGSTCGDNIRGHVMRVSAEGTVSEDESGIVERGDKHCVIGRLPNGLCNEAIAGPNSEIGEYLARQGFLEAASVAAFLDLERELQELGAPKELSLWAARSAQQEKRHALHCRALARKFGATSRVPEVVRTEPRSRFEMALDNAREGLTREAFGALLAHYQAAHAKDADVRNVMTDIAREELQHAEFSIALHGFLMQGLSMSEREQVEAARKRAVADFEGCVLRDESEELRAQLGLPSRAEARLLFGQLFAAEELWS